MRNFLTGRQRAVFNFVRKKIYEGLPPSHREIAAHCGFSVARACHALNQIAKKGYITWEAGKPRTISLLPPYKDDTRCSLIADKDLPQLNIRKGDYLLIDTSKPVADGDVFLSTQGEIKRFSVGDSVFGKVVSFVRGFE